MAKQFKNKEEMDKWIEANFQRKQAGNFFEMPEDPDMAAVSKKLEADGYDLDNLTENGEAYEINGHANNGWFRAHKDELGWLESVGTDMSKVRVD